MEKVLKRNDFYIRTVYSKYLAASVLGILAANVAGMIDTVIVGRYLGETGLSAMSLVSPVYLFYYTIGAVVGMGGSIAANLYIGKNDYDTYRKVFSISLKVMLALCVITTVGGIIFLQQILDLLGGQGIIREYIKEYLQFYLIGGSFTLLIYIPLNFLKMEGKPDTSSMLFLLSGGLNVILTWLFMSPLFGMGIGGASIATGISMGITAAIGLYILLRKTEHTRIVRTNLDRGLLREIILCGSPNGCNNLLNAARIFVVNMTILSIGATACLPAFAMVRSVSDLITGVVTGAAAALMPMIGVYYGEKDWGSIRRVCKKAVLIGGVITFVLLVFIVVCDEWICMLFHITGDEALQSSRIGLLCLALSFLAAFFNLMLSGYFNTVNRPMLSNLILILRLFAFLSPAVFILGNRFGMSGVWTGFIAADFLTLAAVIAVIAVIRRKTPGLDRYLLDTSQEGEGEISFSVKNRIDDVMFASQKITEFCEETGVNMKKTMQLSLALEEMLTVIISTCMDTEREQFVDIRIKKIGDDVLLRIRNAGKIFDLVRYYEENKENEELADNLLGIRIIAGSAKEIQFHDTFGTNNLMIRF